MLIEFLYRALESQFGIKLRTEDPAFTRQKLYAERKKDPAFECLGFVLPPHKSDEVWIIKKEPTDA